MARVSVDAAYGHGLAARLARYAPLLTVLAASLVPLVPILLADPRYVGNDTEAHYARVELLVEQLRTAPLGAGDWTWGWWFGVPFYRLYPPLYGFLAGATAAATPLSVSGAMRAVMATSVVGGGVATYYLARELVGSEWGAALGAVTYVLRPGTVSLFVSAGSPQYYPQQVLSPLVLLFLLRGIRRGDTRSLLAATALVAAVILGHPRAGINVLVVVGVILAGYALLAVARGMAADGGLEAAGLSAGSEAGPSLGRVLEASLVPALGTTLAAAWLLPALSYSRVSTGKIAGGGDSVLNVVSHLYTLGLPSLVALVGAVGFAVRRRDHRFLPLAGAMAYVVLAHPLRALPIPLGGIAFRTTHAAAVLTPVAIAYVVASVSASGILEVRRLDGSGLAPGLRSIRFTRRTAVALGILLLVVAQVGAAPVTAKAIQGVEATGDRTAAERQAAAAIEGDGLDVREVYVANASTLGEWENEGEWTCRDACAGTGSPWAWLDRGATPESAERWTTGITIREGHVAVVFEGDGAARYRVRTSRNSVLKLERLAPESGTVASTKVDVRGDHELSWSVRDGELRVAWDGSTEFVAEVGAVRWTRVGTSSPNATVRSVAASNVVRTGGQYGRVLFLPHQPVGMQVATASRRPVVGGWGPGTPPGFKSLVREYAYDWSGDRVANVARATGTRYVMVSEDTYWPPAFDRHGSHADVSRNLSTTPGVDRVYERDGVAIYAVDGVQGVVTGPVRRVADGEAYLRAASRDPRAIYVGPDESLPDPGTGHRGAVAVHSVTEDGDRMRYEVTADRTTLAVLPVKDSPALSVAVDGDPAERFTAQSEFVGIRVPEGTHAVTVERTRTPIEREGAYLSGVGILLAGAWGIGRRLLDRNQDHDRHHDDG